MTVFLFILNQMEFHLVQNRMEHCHHDHIPFNVKGNGIRVFSVWAPRRGRNYRGLFEVPSNNRYAITQINTISFTFKLKTEYEFDNYPYFFSLLRKKRI